MVIRHDASIEEILSGKAGPKCAEPRGQIIPFNNPVSDMRVVLRTYLKFIKDEDGTFVLTAIRPGLNGEKDGIRTRQYHPSEWDDIERDALHFRNEYNIYFCAVLYDNTLKSKQRGRRDQIMWCLGLVLEEDLDTGKSLKLIKLKGMPEPTFIVETSRDPDTGKANRHIHFVFKTPILPSEHQEIAAMAAYVCGGDKGCIADIDHVWRLPETLNHPNQPKIDRGRSPIPQDVKLVGGTYEPVDAEVVRNALFRAGGKGCPAINERARVYDPDKKPRDTYDALNQLALMVENRGWEKEIFPDRDRTRDSKLNFKYKIDDHISSDNVTIQFTDGKVPPGIVDRGAKDCDHGGRMTALETVMKFMEPDEGGELTQRDFSDFDKDRYTDECVHPTGCTRDQAARWLAEQLDQDWDELQKKYGLASKLEALDEDERAAEFLAHWKVPFDSYGLEAQLDERGSVCFGSDHAEREWLQRIDAAKEQAELDKISFEPFYYQPGFSLPPRQWIYGTSYQRGLLSAIIAPGGLGKSSLTVVEALAMVTGRPILGEKVLGGPLRVAIISLEDKKLELHRRIIAAMDLHRIGPKEIEDDVESRLFIFTEKNGFIKIATQDRDGVRILKPVVGRLKKLIREHKIDAVIIDPFVSCHDVNENDNGAIDLVAKTWAAIASDCKCAICLVHHTRKMGTNGDSGAEDARGAKSFVDACRNVRKLVPMTEAEGKELGCEDKHWTYFRVTTDKRNQTPAQDAVWRHIEGVLLGNGNAVNRGDDVGVVEEWSPRGLLERNPEWAQVALKVLADGKHRPSPQSDDYAGKAITVALGLDFDDKAVKAQMKALIAKLLSQARIEIVYGKDKHRNDVKFLKVTDPK